LGCWKTEGGGKGQSNSGQHVELLRSKVERAAQLDVSFQNLQYIDLSYFDLQGVNLRNADLQGANLWGINLSDAYLQGANLSDADLDGADLSCAHLGENEANRVVLHRAKLSYATLRELDLHGFDLMGLDLSNTDLNGTNLRNALLRGTDLRGADLSTAQLYGPELRGAILYSHERFSDWPKHAYQGKSTQKRLASAKPGLIQERTWPIQREEYTMQVEHLVIGGERVPAAEGRTFAVIEPGSGKPFAEVAEAGAEDVERAMRAAHRAFEEGRWPRLSATERGRILLQAATLVRQRLEDIAVIEARNQASPFGMLAVKLDSSPWYLSTGEEQQTRFSARPFRYRILGLKWRFANRLECAH
jgi:hypothetical protein